MTRDRLLVTMMIVATLVLLMNCAVIAYALNLLGHIR